MNEQAQRGPRRHLNYSNLMATLAVFVALGGTGYAVSQLPKNSVKARQIAKDAVRTGEIKANAVGSSEVADNAIAAAEIKDGEVGATEIGDGAVASSDVADGGLGSADLASDSLVADNLAPGSVGSSEAIDNSLAADDLAIGSVGSSEVIDNALGGGDVDESSLDLELRRESSSTAFNSSSPKELTEECPPGTQLISAFANSGGARTGASPDEVINIAWEGFVMPGGSSDPPREVFARAVELPGGFAGNWAIALQLICADIAG